MRRITSEQQLTSLRKNRPDQTETWLVDDAVWNFATSKSESDVRQMTTEEVHEMATYLEVKDNELQGPFYVARSLKCPDCGRATTFLDFIKTAVDAKLHEKSLMRDVLCGRSGRWLTLVGKTGERTLACAHCNRLRRIAARGDCNYTGTHYRYDSPD